MNSKRFYVGILKDKNILDYMKRFINKIKTNYYRVYILPVLKLISKHISRKCGKLQLVQNT